MISNLEFQAVNSEQFYDTEEILDFECLTPNHNDDEMLIKKKIQLILGNNKKEILYMLDGQILRSDRCQPIQIMTNLEQIKHLRWIGDLNLNKNKKGKWIALWKDDCLGVGGYYRKINNYQQNKEKDLYSEDGIKQGAWKEMIKDFWDGAKVFEIGEYQNGNRTGFWNYTFEIEKIGGGFYKENGLKHGSWIELSDNFSQFSQITYKGEYQEDKKVGQWLTLMRRDGKNEFIKIGGGSYCENEKDGDWIELSDYFSNLSQVIYQGQYKIGKKQGRWEILQRFGWDSKFQLIGEGYFDENGMKQGKWLELCNCFQSYIQLTFNGEYQRNLKIGSWQTQFREYSGDKYSQIGGGSFDQSGIKTGPWVEQSEGIYRNYQLIFQGEYQNGQKVGIWNNLFREHANDQFKNIGGGLFNLNGKKDGIWEEVSDQLGRNVSIIQKGQYNNGRKYGTWDIKFQGQIIGGGNFNVNGMKEGEWVDLCDQFSRYFLVIYEYNIIHAVKFNSFVKVNTKMGEGLVNGVQCQLMNIDMMEKILGTNFKLEVVIMIRMDQKMVQVILIFTILRMNLIMVFKIFISNTKENRILKQLIFKFLLQLVGFNSQLQQVIFYSNQIKSMVQVTLSGNYKNGIKIGDWKIMFKKFFQNKIEQFGGGYFDENGMKVGEWSILKDGFNNLNQTIIRGVYKNGQKIGIWSIMQKENENEDEFKKKGEIDFNDAS